MQATISLTDEQRAVAESDEGTTLCLASPGSGKTLVVAARIAHLIERGARPDEIRCFVFTRAAAADIRSRVDRFCGRAVGERVDVCTFHEFAARALKGATIATDAESEAALRSLYAGPLRRAKVPTITAMKRSIRHFEATGIFPAGTDDAADIVRDRLTRCGLVPLWSLIPTIGEVDQVQHVLVDEAQDCTPLEGRIAVASLAGGGSLTVVGDERQAIHGWRGADMRAAFSTVDFGAALPLAQSFRFGQEIADFANEIAGTEPRLIGAGEPGEVLEADSPIVAATEFPTALILARTNHECELIERRMAGAGVVAKGSADPLTEAADTFAAIWSAGRAVISTIHSAKGREADTVIVAAKWSSNPTQEERNLAFVATTRTRLRLITTEPIQ